MQAVTKITVFLEVEHIGEPTGLVTVVREKNRSGQIKIEEIIIAIKRNS